MRVFVFQDGFKSGRMSVGGSAGDLQATEGPCSHVFWLFPSWFKSFYGLWMCVCVCVVLHGLGQGSSAETSKQHGHWQEHLPPGHFYTRKADKWMNQPSWHEIKASGSYFWIKKRIQYEWLTLAKSGSVLPASESGSCEIKVNTWHEL